MSEERKPYPRAVVDNEQMNLPAGKTCGDCVHCKRCTMMFGHIPADKVCDWSPSRFRAVVPAKACAASIGGVHCQQARADNSLFCVRHKHASNRLYLPTVVTNDSLAFMMQRDGEIQ